MAQILNAFSVDVEDYFHVTAFEKHIDRSQWSQLESRVVQSTNRLLRLLNHQRTLATFFVLGWVARQHPDLVRRIHDAGHEIASHGFWHRLIYQQTPDQFRDDLRQSRDVLEDIIKEPVIAYRAPSFSITSRSMWALEVLVEEGFRVDSSIFPTYHDRYGMPDAPLRIHEISTECGRLVEFPPSVVQFGKTRLPVAGGGYFRLYPAAWTFHCLRRINKTTHQPFMFYVHPWEVDPDQPRLQAGTRTSRLRHYLNLRRTENRLEMLLERFSFGPMREVISRHHAGENTEGQPTALCHEAKPLM